jgi:hypothetical protein
MASEYENEELSSYVGRTVRVFVSYSTEDKEFAGSLKRSLERLGLEVFLAHEDINPSADWPEAILQNLKSTDIFIPLITENFRKSEYTDQESGVALSENKLIFPIAVDEHMPYGFLSKIQAFRQNSSFPISPNEIIKAIIRSKPEFTSPLLDSVIKSFTLSYNWEDAGLKSNVLLIFDIMTEEQVNEIFRGVIQNGEIYGSFAARANVKKLFDKYEHLLDKKLLEELNSKEELASIFRD